MVRSVCAAALAALLAAACGGGGGGGGDDDGSSDHRDGGTSIDAAVVPPDAAPPVNWPLSLQVVAGAGHVEGDGYQMDLQVGDFVDQHTMQGGGFTMEGAAVVKQQGGAP
jgi:hypothetical protein